MASFSTSIGTPIKGNTVVEDLKKPESAELALEEIQTEKFYNIS